MRLGIVGMLPNDFRQITPLHLETLQGLGLTGASFHREGTALTTITAAECQRIRTIFQDVGMDLPQFGIGYRECLFDPDAAVRAQVTSKIERGIEVAHELGAHYCLIRTGSLNPRGSYSPSASNHTADARARLVETLLQVAAKADAIGQTVVIETHVLTIMNSPETNAAIINEIGSDRLRIVMDYVNHFQTLAQVYDSTARIDHIFNTMGAISPVGHCKDIRLDDGLVLHISEEIPGDGELDIATVLRRWHALYPEGYMLLEHLHAKEGITPSNHPGLQLGWSSQEMATFDLYARGGSQCTTDRSRSRRADHMRRTFVEARRAAPLQILGSLFYRYRDTSGKKTKLSPALVGADGARAKSMVKFE
ncbi:MAG: sugar phosphate isomerase/epimerase family protein [Caldilineaceae bacterium]